VTNSALPSKQKQGAKQKQRALANQQQQASVERMSRLGRNMVMLLATVLSFVTVTLLVVDRLYRPDNFVINQLKIQGQFRYLAPTEIESLVRSHELGNFFAINLDVIKADIQTHPWVQEAEVRREWPDALNVHVKEHRPVARWKKDKWVNAQGQVVDLPIKDMPRVAIVLDGKPQDAAMMLNQTIAWKRQLESSGLLIRQLELSTSHAWTLSLYYPLNDFEFTLLLGREDVAERLARFQNLFDKRFKDANEQLQRVDARYPDGLAIKSKPLPLKPELALADFLVVDNLNLINQSPAQLGKRYE